MEVDIEELLKGTPRPHYLFGKGAVYIGDSVVRLVSPLLFSSDGDDSVRDRLAVFPGPHANIGSFNFSVANALHVARVSTGYSLGTYEQGKPFITTLHGILPVDTELVLDTQIYGDFRERGCRGRFISEARDGERVLSVSDGYICAKK